MRYVTWQRYAGYQVLGTVPMGLPSGDLRDSHLARASWLTAQVESGGKFGAVISGPIR